MFFSNQTQIQSKPKHWICASYVRLSKEDEDAANGGKDESNSVTNQKAMIQSYLEEHPELELYKEYVDDGYSGVSFDRPEFNRMLSDVKDRKVNCIIVKDLSRFGRNYIEAGKYLEQVFPFLGVRFIAITDKIDTGKEQSDSDQFVLPFKNLFNDAYSRDISTKVRSHLAVKRKNGQFVGSFACYGYFKDPADHNKLVIDPEAAEVVKQIFYWKIQGLSTERIADKLNALGILCPMEYKHSLGMRVSSNFRTKGKAQWAPKSVLRILKNDLYIGTMTQGKKTTPSYKVKKIINKPEEEWDRVEGTHEPIIHKDIFDVVQKLLLRDTRIAPDEKKLYLFSGFLCCAERELFSPVGVAHQIDYQNIAFIWRKSLHHLSRFADIDVSAVKGNQRSIDPDAAFGAKIIFQFVFIDGPNCVFGWRRYIAVVIAAPEKGGGQVGRRKENIRFHIGHRIFRRKFCRVFRYAK